MRPLLSGCIRYCSVPLAEERVIRSERVITCIALYAYGRDWLHEGSYKPYNTRIVQESGFWVYVQVVDYVWVYTVRMCEGLGMS